MLVRPVRVAEPHRGHERGEGAPGVRDERRRAAGRGMRHPADLSGLTACAGKIQARRARAKRYACGLSGPGSGSGCPGVGVGSGSGIGVGSLMTPPLDSGRACTHDP
jgi:hypothetical protein